MEALIEQTGSIKLNGSRNAATPLQECLKFNPPNRKAWVRNVMVDIPRYLFRTYSPKSDGATNPTWAMSVDASRGWEGCDVDLFAQDEDEVAYMLNQHLRWWPKDHCMDNLVSWTSSLLFALQHAIYKRQNPRDGSEWHEIQLCVIDTTKFPSGAFIRDIDLMRSFAGINEKLDNQRQLREGVRRPRDTGLYYFGEYLSQGALRVKDKCSIVSMDKIFDCGLSLLQPHFNLEVETGPPMLSKEVIRLRKEFNLASSHHWVPVSEPHTQAAFKTGSLFGQVWKLPMMASFLSLRPISDDDLMFIRDIFRTNFTGLVTFLVCSETGN